MKLILSLSTLILAGSAFIAPTIAASTTLALPSARKISVPVSGQLVSYAGGWCGVHVTEYHGPDHSRISVSLFDQDGAQIGGIRDANAPANEGVGITSQLPYVLIVTTGTPIAPVSFRYADQSWDSNNSERCSVGGYDRYSFFDLKRDMDCGFSC